MKNNNLFKNMVIYKFTEPFQLTGEQLEAQLSQKTFRTCGSQDVSTYGWVPALHRTTNTLVHEANGCLLICAARQERILPPSVIRDALEEKVEQIEQEQDRQVFSKEKKALTDDIIMELLPRAFTKTIYTQAYIDKQDGWMVVNTGSYRQAEELTSCLRECLGSLPIIHPPVKKMPSFVMTQWLETQDLPAGFEMGSSCELRTPGDDGTIIARNEELASDEIHQHLASGKIVSKLHINWQATIHGELSDDLRFTKVKYTDLFQDKLDECEADTLLQQMESDFVLMSGTFRRFLNSLVSDQVLGLEQEAQQ